MDGSPLNPDIITFISKKFPANEREPIISTSNSLGLRSFSTFRGVTRGPMSKLGAIAREFRGERCEVEETVRGLCLNWTHAVVEGRPPGRAPTLCLAMRWRVIDVSD